MRMNDPKPARPPPENMNITLPNNINITYAYLPNGDRIMRSNDTETIYYLYDREDRIGDYDINGNLLISYTHGPGIDEPVAMAANGNTYFYIPDIQGGIRAIVDTNGNAVATYQYDVWGTLVSYGGSLAEKNDYLYTGREYDWETGIYYYRARYYNPELGRFLTQDPAGMVDGPNMYVYVKNEPVNGVDPNGNWACCIKWGWKTISTLTIDTPSFEKCIDDAFHTPGLGQTVALAIGSCLPLLVYLPAFVSCVTPVLEAMGIISIGVVDCAYQNTHWVYKNVYTCIQPCYNLIGGGKVPVPGPRPPIVGPLPMKYLWHSFYPHIKAVSPWS